MYTTYAMMLATRRWTDGTRAQLVDRVEQWRQSNFPPDRIPGNLRIRVRRAPDDEVYRLALEVADNASTFKKTTVITVTPHNGRLVVDVRVHNEPGRDAIIPRKRAELPPRPVIDLICEIASSIEVYDAERRVAPTVRTIATSLEGEALAADVLTAPTRRLPIVVESVIGKSPESSLTTALAIDLIGVAHVVQVVAQQAIDGFNGFFGSVVLDRNYVSILWPQPEEPLTIATSQPSRDQIVLPVLSAAALQPTLVVQPPPRTLPQSRPTTPPSTDTSTMTQLAMLRHEIEEHRSHIEQLDDELERTENERAETAEQLEEEQIRVEELTTEISLLRGRLSAVILQAVDLEAELERAKPERVMRRVLDAVNRARTECTNLEFARSAFETADKLHGPNPRDILHDLKALDSAVAAWHTDSFPSAGLTSYLRDTSGLDFVARIGEDTINRHGSWYSISHNGEVLHIGPHLRAGKNRTLNRIYLHVDSDKKRIVVGKVVAHGPDSTS
ncbi:MAG: hypothetical protein ACO33B_03545 [Ilumatobacteraceae bacterium]